MTAIAIWSGWSPPEKPAVPYHDTCTEAQKAIHPRPMPRALAAYAGTYTERTPVLLYPRDYAYEVGQPGSLKEHFCLNCGKVFRCKMKSLCCSPVCATRRAGRDLPTSRKPRLGERATP